MDHFSFRNGRLHAETVDLAALAREHGTPAYVYSRAALENHYQRFDDALASAPHLICYAVKANSNIAVLNVLARMGAGFDIVSGGELARVLAAGGDPTRIVFSGVGKTAEEMRAALTADIRCFNVESVAELDRLSEVASEAHQIARVSLRVNPDVDARTHPYISTGLKENKFGIDISEAESAFQRAAALPGLEVVGVDCHIGSQLTDMAPFIDALDRVLSLVDRLQESGICLHHIDLGGGLGVRYNEEEPPLPSDYAEALLPRLEGRELELIIEPGRAIAANAGLLLTRVEYLKHTPHRNFAIVDAAMNDLLRPALYSAWQKIEAVEPRQNTEAQRYDVVGPVCETGDWLGKDRDLAIEAGDLLAVHSAGAYGFTMSSNYNSRPRAVEIMVDGDQAHVVRERESVESLYSGENLLPTD